MLFVHGEAIGSQPANAPDASPPGARARTAALLGFRDFPNWFHE